jgi:hypothetical protein
LPFYSAKKYPVVMWGRRGYKRNNRACKQDHLRQAGFRTISGGNWLGRTWDISFRTQLLLLGYHLTISALLWGRANRVLNHLTIFITIPIFVIGTFPATINISTPGMGNLTYIPVKSQKFASTPRQPFCFKCFKYCWYYRPFV